MTSLQIHLGRQRAVPIDVLLSMIPSLPRPMLDRLVDRAIDHMDRQDGDCDIEANGDELDGVACGEDEFWPHSTGHFALPGCPVSDPGEDNFNNEEEDQRQH